MDIERQPIRILLDAGNRLVTIGLINTDGPSRPHPMRVEEDHDLPDDFLGLPRLDHSLFAFGANPIELSQPFRRLFNDIKHLLTKGLDQLFSKMRPDTFDHPRAQILFNAFEGTRWDDAEGLRLKLQAMGPIVDPDALPLYVLARGDRRCSADDGDQIAVPTHLDPEDTEASLLAMEGHPLHGTGQLFCGMGEG